MEITLSVNASHCHLPRKGEVLLFLLRSIKAPPERKDFPRSGQMSRSDKRGNLASVSETERVVLR